MTRMTSVNMGNAPKDSIFGIRDIKGPRMPKEKSDVAMVGEKISIGSTGFHASDRTFSAGNFSAGSKMRPKDTVFGGGSVTAGRKIQPNDSTFTGSGISESIIIIFKLATILPKDSAVAGGISPGGRVKKPKELLSDNIRMKNGASQGPKELLSDNVKVRGGASRPKDDIFARPPGGRKPAEKPGESAHNKSSFSGQGDFTHVSSAKKKVKKNDDSKDEDLFWA